MGGRFLVGGVRSGGRVWVGLRVIVGWRVGGVRRGRRVGFLGRFLGVRIIQRVVVTGRRWLASGLVLLATHIFKLYQNLLLLT